MDAEAERLGGIGENARQTEDIINRDGGQLKIKR
jgi:hypothetical protein